MTTFKGKKVLITGGASGIGELMGELSLQKGAELVIWDINKTKLEKTVSRLSSLGPVHGYPVDISDYQQCKKTAQKVIQDVGAIDILINNAGIVVGKYFNEHSVDEIKRSMEINANAPMLLSHLFLPGMLEQNSGHICNIASSAGLISNPKMSVYVASKWALVGWSDSLRLEMKLQKRNVKVTTVTPYYIDTGMFDGIKSMVPILNPQKVTKKIIRAIEKEKIILSMPWGVRFVRFFQGLMPIWMFDWFVGRVLGIYKTMEHYKGHKNSNN